MMDKLSPRPRVSASGASTSTRQFTIDTGLAIIRVLFIVSKELVPLVRLSKV